MDQKLKEQQINKKKNRIQLSLAACRVIEPNMMYNPVLNQQAAFASKIMDKMFKNKK